MYRNQGWEIQGSIPFWHRRQQPELTDYADGVDTLNFSHN